MVYNLVYCKINAFWEGASSGYVIYTINGKCYESFAKHDYFNIITDAYLDRIIFIQDDAPQQVLQSLRCNCSKSISEIIELSPVIFQPPNIQHHQT